MEAAVQLLSDSEQFELGKKEGLDRSMLAADVSGAMITSLDLYWLPLRCWRTGHTFRIGDPVIVEFRGPRLAIDPDKVTEAAASAAEFVEGLNEAWPPLAGVRGLMPGDPMLDPPKDALPRASCFMCGHTFRPFENVLICPCQPTNPLCRKAVHRHPALGLNCYKSWDGSHCPATFRKLT